MARCTRRRVRNSSQRRGQTNLIFAMYRATNDNGRELKHLDELDEHVWSHCDLVF
jgi:hypothetical protein